MDTTPSQTASLKINNTVIKEVAENDVALNNVSLANTDHSMVYSNETSSSHNTHSLLENARSDSFEEYIMRPSSPNKVKYQEDIEDILNQDGSKVKTIKTFKEITGACPRINAKEAVGRQIRELSATETTGGVLSYTDLKKETIIGEDGTKLVRTSQVARIKYARPHYRNSSASSLFSDTNHSYSHYAHNRNRSILHKKSAGLDTSNNRDISFSIRPFTRSVSQQPQFINFGRRDSNRQFYHRGLSSGNYYYEQQNAANVVYDRGNRNYLYTSPQLSTTRSRSAYANSSSGLNRFSMPGLGLSLNSRCTPTIREVVPPTFSYELENITVKQGGIACFKGTVNGSYPFETRWYVNNRELEASDQHVEITTRQDYSETFLTGLIDYIISLRIFNCSYNDIGKYTAFVRNDAGDACCSAFLVFEGRIINDFKINSYY